MVGKEEFHQQILIIPFCDLSTQETYASIQHREYIGEEWHNFKKKYKIIDVGKFNNNNNNNKHEDTKTDDAAESVLSCFFTSSNFRLQSNAY